MAAFASANDRFPADLWITRQVQELRGDFIVQPLDWAESLVEWPSWGVIAVLAIVAAVAYVGMRVLPVAALAVLARELPPSVKDIVERPRPSGELVDVSDQAANPISFPSGHAFNAVILFGLIFYLATFYVSSHWLRLAVQTGCVSLTAAASIARVHSGLHWPSDIVGGLLLGLLVVTMLVGLGESLPGGRLARSRQADT
jgi:undecaprenyl-diphosphatase